MTYVTGHVVASGAGRPAIFPSAFWPHIGGIEELTRQLGQQFLSRGGAPLIVTHRWPKHLPRREEFEGLSVAREVFRVPVSKPKARLAHFLLSPVARQRVVKLAREHRSDVIHVQGVSNNAPYALATARLLDLPLIVTMQGEISMDAGRAYESSTVRENWRRLLDGAAAITGCSQYVIDEAQQLYGKPFAGRVAVIPNGVSLTEIGAIPAVKKERRFIFGIGRLVPQKGFDVLIDAFSLIAASHPDVDLVIGGTGPLADELYELVATKSLNNRVFMPGTMDRRQTIGHFKAAEVFVLPSRHEPQGIVILEAFASGVPVIAADVGGVSEILREGINGHLFPAANPGALADLMTRRLRSGPDQVLINAGRTLAESLDWPSVAAKYETVYRSS